MHTPPPIPWRRTPYFFAAALVLFWLTALCWAWQHPSDRNTLDPITFDYRIDVNTADAATLQLLPGVGPSIAQNLVEHRDRGHRFEQPRDFENVHQIGRHTAERIMPWVQFTPNEPD